MYANAFAANAKLANDLKAQHRYIAAYHAALAGCGHGKDANQSDAKERTRLRQQARDWLWADLAAYDKETNRILVNQRLRQWLIDRDLAGIRDEKELAHLPADERQACEKLWAEVTAQMKKLR
jgi:cytochrome c553